MPNDTLPNAVPLVNDRSIHRLIRDFARTHDQEYQSCLDIGCGRARYDKWFERFEAAAPPGTYLGIEKDTQIIRELREQGVEAKEPDALPDAYRADLTLGIEVLEHLTEDEALPFLKFVGAHTNKLFAITTPNFEYWQEFGTSSVKKREDLRECRWLPDHVTYYDPQNPSPHVHRQMMTPDLLAKYYDKAFPKAEWEYRIYRAWPWRLTDESVNRSFTLAFKLFALAWRKEVVTSGTNNEDGTAKSSHGPSHGRTPNRRYRILKYPWHTGHDYELAKLPHEFYYLSNTPRRWAENYRPVPSNIEWVPNRMSVSTDLMILHVDQWTFHEPAKRALFLRYRDNYAGPKVVINHGSNMVDGCSSETMRELVEGCKMVSNSPTALSLWDVPGSVFILHGMSPEEWPPTDYARNEVLVVQPFSHMHAECRNTDGALRASDLVPMTWVGRDKKFANFGQYRHFLQSSSVFLQPSYASANPRARTEAMLTGLAVVTTCAHGEEEYIRNGVNGFASNDFDELLDALKYLVANPQRAREIGRAGRKTAQRVFHIDRFKTAWNRLLTEYVG